MNRVEFEAIRELADKVIAGDVRFVERRTMAPLLVAEDVRIDNSDGVDLRLTITVNPAVGSTSLNVHVPGTGPICRLDVDGPPHRPAGRTHKHSVQTERCPDRNLPDEVVDRPDLSGLPVEELFRRFCAMASIEHRGRFHAPATVPGAGL